MLYFIPYSLYIFFFPLTFGTMKTLLILVFMASLWSGCSDHHDGPVPQEEEISLFDKNGKPVAYLYSTPDEQTIYLWKGTPVAYISNTTEIYHFNGQFLGWYADGIVYDRSGYARMARKGLTTGEIQTVETSAEPVKHVKKVKPVPHVPSVAPAPPRFKAVWNREINGSYKFLLTEITLFDKEKDAIAYIDYAEEKTIYLWNGTPVAYVKNETEIYCFNGRFLGWYVEGIVYDRKGYAVAAEENVVSGAIVMDTPNVEPVKDIKDMIPAKKTQEEVPATPNFETIWSETSLSDFFLPL